MSDATKQATHTPGPWSWSHDNNWLEAPDPTFPDREDYGHIVMEAVSAEMMPSKANARLIAAAPELLEACEKALTALEHVNERMGISEDEVDLPNTIRAAITKAKGYTDA